MIVASLQEMETEIRSSTIAKHREVVDCIENILDAYLNRFGRLGSFVTGDANRMELVWLFLSSRAFNSLRKAYDLALESYYSQAITLVRSALEDWLACQDCSLNADTVDALLDGDKPVDRPRQMVDRLPEELKNIWRGIDGQEGLYGLLSTLAHPRSRAIRFAYEPEDKTLRLGPVYEETLFIFTAYPLILVARRMMEFVARLAHPADRQGLPR